MPLIFETCPVRLHFIYIFFKLQKIVAMENASFVCYSLLLRYLRIYAPDVKR